MRTGRPVTGDPWPTEMTIHIDDFPGHLCQLLFIRSAWDLAPDAGLPALDPVPDPGTSNPPLAADRREWSARWLRAWSRGWDWYRLRDRPGQAPHPALPPRWSAEHGMDGVDQEAYHRWKGLLRPDRGAPEAEAPERLCLAQLVPAWQAGLRAIVLLPYQGHYAEAFGPRHLVVSAATRNDQDRYGEALDSFAHTGGVHDHS